MYVPEWILILIFTAFGSVLFYLVRQIINKIMNKEDNKSNQLCEVHDFKISTMEQNLNDYKKEIKENIKEFKEEIIKKIDKLEQKIDKMFIKD